VSTTGQKENTGMRQMQQDWRAKEKERERIRSFRRRKTEKEKEGLNEERRPKIDKLSKE
jgi:hypothetical protein